MSAMPIPVAHHSAVTIVVMMVMPVASMYALHKPVTWSLNRDGHL